VNADEERFKALFEANFGDVLAYAVRRCRTREDAEDVVAETFAVAWRRLADMPQGDQARPWLFGTAHLIRGNHERARGRQRFLVDRLASAAGPRDIGAGTMPPENSVGLSSDPAIGRALDVLSETDREVLLLHVWEDLTAEEIGLVLKITTPAVWKRLQRARERLARALDRKSDRSTESDRPAPPTLRRTAGKDA
jgi:RNA polymerase sigma-70 factor (ECF subfamily)